MNRVILLGRIGKQPDTRYTPAGTAVTTMSMATTERYAKDGEKQEKTTWHNLVIWGKLAEVVGKHVSKGDQLLVEGRIDNRSYDGNDGTKKYISEVVVSSFEFVGSKPQEQRQQEPRQSSAPSGGGMNQEPAFNPDDEIPFAMPRCYREEI